MYFENIDRSTTVCKAEAIRFLYILVCCSLVTKFHPCDCRKIFVATTMFMREEAIGYVIYTSNIDDLFIQEHKSHQNYSHFLAFVWG